MFERPNSCLHTVPYGMENCLSTGSLLDGDLQIVAVKVPYPDMPGDHKKSPLKAGF